MINPLWRRHTLKRCRPRMSRARFEKILSTSEKVSAAQCHWAIATSSGTSWRRSFRSTVEVSWRSELQFSTIVVSSASCTFLGETGLHLFPGFSRPLSPGLIPIYLLCGRASSFSFAKTAFRFPMQQITLLLHSICPTKPDLRLGMFPYALPRNRLASPRKCPPVRPRNGYRHVDHHHFQAAKARE